MQDPCDPTPHHAHVIVHHHPPGQVIGRIRRHGTHRIARRLHAIAGTCAAGPPLVVGSATFKAVAPAVAFVALTSAASQVIAPDETPPPDGFSEFVAPVFGSPGAIGASPPRHAVHHHHPPVAIPEPPSLTLLALASLGWVWLVLGRRRFKAKQDAARHGHGRSGAGADTIRPSLPSSSASPGSLGLDGVPDTRG